MSNRTVIRTVITPRAITRRVGPAGAGGGTSTFAGLTDKATADLPAINTPLSTALAGKQPLDADLTAIAALTTTANGRALLTSPNALSIGPSAYVSGSNTGDNAVNIRYSGLVTNATHTGDVTGSTELTLATVNGNVGAWGTSSSTPTFTVDEKGRITEVFEQTTQISVYNVFDMGGGVSTALSIGVDTYGGFLTAGIGDTLPIERGGTGSTTASFARTALGSQATGDALFTAVTPAAARTTLKLGSTDTPTFGGLDLLTAGTTTLNVYNSLSGANFERLSFRWASNIARIGTAKGGTGTARDLALETDGTERVRVLSTGSVGIGTTAPTAALHVVKGATPTLTSIFANPAGDVFNQFAAQSGTGEYGVWQDALYFQALASLGNGIRFFIGSTNALQIAAPSGNVGIGTSTPSALLDVNSDTVRVRTARTPASATAAGNAGDICWDANYIYVCTATNTWKRTAISTWP